MACEPALGVVRLRRLVSFSGGREGVGRGVMVKRGPSPSAAVREPLAIPLHEVDVFQGTRHCRRRIGRLRTLCRLPMDLRHLGAVGERLAVVGNTGPVGVDHRRIGEDQSERVIGLTDGDGLPVLVAFELREREATRHVQREPILRCKGYVAQDSEQAATITIAGMFLLVISNASFGAA
jgi:hypothetical protein